MVATPVAGAAARGADALLVRRPSLVHRLPAQVKLVALLAFVVVVVATPRTAWPAFVAYGVLLAGVIALARLPFGVIARRMFVETPFVVFALLMPFVASGPRVDVLGLSVSESGLIGGAVLLVKGSLGVVAAIVLAATTESREMLVGLERLRLPGVLVAIIGFAIRYLSIAGDDLERARIARLARGGSGGRASQLRSVAGTVGSTFVRTYERGERVHRAMLARGLDGPMPVLSGRAATAAEWRTAFALPTAALVVLVAGLVLT
ncbi:cobalt ECF transporter T component CbiQ [Luteipulveratus sp. YIM 133132]|uniref:cobalt ECF transporter T component CbiQ n=1 Tax=Luteipulveratus flavus TaxID=3031728 RepID=UPI0023B098A6|nr:cobalt ECF transporter T component CbiQ [Luteipulveratus sp. YIM 133132]MDE9364153.1 cobalt ECF transporter T component CbiQ [Luteipulveratus sp. YIM 133132]